MYGIIDIGSNTMRLSCYKVVEKQLIPVFHKKSMAGLAGYVDGKNCLSDSGIQTAVDTLKDFNNIIMCVGLDKLYVIATASFRNVDNTEKIIRKIYEKTGIEVCVLSGEEEAFYDFKGATCGNDAGTGIVVDIGGGSTELVCFKEEQADRAVSIPIGSLNMFSRFVKELFPTAEEEAEIRACVREQLDRIGIKKHKTVLGVGGSTRACMKLYNNYYHMDVKNKYMSCEKMNAMLTDISDNRKSFMNRILKIVPDRIHTIFPGMIILDEIINYYRCQDIYLSDWGVREGYMLEKVL